MSDSATPCTTARQAPLSMEFSSQEYWGGWTFPAPGDLADSLSSEPPGKPLQSSSSIYVSFSWKTTSTEQLCWQWGSIWIKFPWIAHRQRRCSVNYVPLTCWWYTTAKEDGLAGLPGGQEPPGCSSRSFILLRFTSSPTYQKLFLLTLLLCPCWWVCVLSVGVRFWGGSQQSKNKWEMVLF